jgi:hypothetical protein
MLEPQHLLMALILLAGEACRTELEIYDPLGPRHEARQWLATNANPLPFASNRFESKAAAAAFVDSLYAWGADTVYVLNVQQDSAWLSREGGPYADALLLRLSDDPGARARLFQVNAREARHEGFEPEPDRRQRYLYFWWD